MARGRACTSGCTSACPTLATVSPGRWSPNLGLSLGRLESEDEEEHVGVEDDLAVAGGD